MKIKIFNKHQRRSPWVRVAILFIGIAIFWSSQIHAQIIIPKKDYVPDVRQSRYSFGISLMEGPSSTHITYGIVREKPDSTREIIFLTESSFIRQVSGAEASKANPDTINFFELYGIDPTVLQDLWKLKHDKDPYGVAEGYGTATGAPSKNQYVLLKSFGIGRLSDYAYGDNLWRFLKKASDPVWLGNYQMSR